jgi:cupin fold WbuC family metalloprotein
MNNEAIKSTEVISIYSIKEPGTLLHSVVNSLAIKDNRIDITPPDKYLQASIIPFAFGKIVQPHIHTTRQEDLPGATITQESWVVMRGKLRIWLFDFDGTLLREGELLTGSVLVTYNGGHSLECLEPDTVILEFKNGPYLGRDFVPLPVK